MSFARLKYRLLTGQLIYYDKVLLMAVSVGCWTAFERADPLECLVGNFQNNTVRYNSSVAQGHSQALKFHCNELDKLPAKHQLILKTQSVLLNS